MRAPRCAVLILLVAPTAFAKPDIAKPTSLAMPEGAAGIGFDDLGFSPALHRVLAPGGRTGKLDLVDPKMQAIESVTGVSTDADKFGGSHGEGTTSADVGGGMIFASDRSRGEVTVVDPKTMKITAATKLAGGPDYVRWIEPTSEVWVTEPSKKQIEVFTLDGRDRSREAQRGCALEERLQSLAWHHARRKARAPIRRLR